MNNVLPLANIMNYEEAKNHLIIELGNESSIPATDDPDKELIVKHLIKPTLSDIVIFFKLLLSTTDSLEGDVVRAVIPVTRKHLNIWGISKTQLFNDAVLSSSELNPALVMPMANMFVNMLSKMDIPAENMPDGNGLIVITHENQIRGAAAILYPGVKKKVAELIGGDYFLMPSSVHEWLATPIHDFDSVNDISDIVKTVNMEVVEPEDFLSDHVYVCRKSHDYDIEVAI